MATIALLTDFGTTDSYVGVMKAVMARIAPSARFIDLTHEIQPQNVFQGAFTLLNSYRYFAPGTIFLAVVDPGVGGGRAPIAAQVGGYTFVGPDNGLLSLALAELGDAIIVELRNAAYQWQLVSYTFHGRDIFAPAAAHLAVGVPLADFGPRVERIVRQPAPALRVEGNQIAGEVLYADHFGNLVTSIGQLHCLGSDKLELKPRFGAVNPVLSFDVNHASVTIQKRHIPQLFKTYAESQPGDLVALVGSNGYLEIAVNQGSALEQLHTLINAPVVLKIG
jgi:hypothetical protein